MRKTKLKTKEEFKAYRYIMLRKQLYLYLLMFLANDKNTNKDIIIDRNLTVINAVTTSIWWILTDALFNSIFLVLGDLFDVRYKVKGSLLKHLTKEDDWESSIEKQLKKYDLEDYIDIIKKLYKIRDKYIVHTEKITEDEFPFKLSDMYKLEDFLDKVEEKVLDPSIKDTDDFYFYKSENYKDDILQEFDHGMDTLYIDYFSIDGEIDEETKEKKEKLAQESWERRDTLLKVKRKSL